MVHLSGAIRLTSGWRELSIVLHLTPLRQIVSTLGPGPHLQTIQERLPPQAQGGGRTGPGLPPLLLLGLLRGAPGLLHQVLLVRVEAVPGRLDCGGAGERHGPVEGVLYVEVGLDDVMGVVPGLGVRQLPVEGRGGADLPVSVEISLRSDQTKQNSKLN